MILSGQKKSLTWGLLSLWVIMSLLLSSCAAKPTNQIVVRLALLPIVDTLPLYVARDAGYFKAEGVQVEFIPVASAAERDQVVGAGKVDGVVNDLVSIVLYNRDQPTLQVVRFMEVSQPGHPLYRILASGKSGITSVRELVGVPVAISQGSVINYVTDQLLLAGGLKEEDIKIVAVPKIPDRMALLASGELKVATLPEPFATIAAAQGAVVLTDDTKVAGLGNSVLSFRMEFINKNPDVVKHLLIALEKAIAQVNSQPESARPVFTTYKLVPETMAATFPVPAFPKAGVPDQPTYDQVAAWALAHKLVERLVPYADSVRTDFVNLN